MIGILDAGMGNLRSVSNAVYNLGFDFIYVDKPDKFDGISHLILPGVGAFGTAMRRLEQKKIKEVKLRLSKIYKFCYLISSNSFLDRFTSSSSSEVVKEGA